MTEVIAACGFETWAPGVGEHSFTRSLIDELKYWSLHRKLSVALLHQKVLSRIKYWKPRYASTEGYECRKTPIYVGLSNEGRQRSIDLSPLPSTDCSPVEDAPMEDAIMPQETSFDCSGSSSESQITSDGNRTESSQSSLDHTWPDTNLQSPKALISIALEEDQALQTDEWLQWIRSIPALVKYVHVEGIFKSGSTLILLSLPIAVWDSLPKNPAIQFIHFIESDNLVLSKYFRRGFHLSVHAAVKFHGLGWE